MQSHIDPPKPVRPYKHIRLTVESDRFVLQPYFGPEYTDDADTEIVQIQFEISEDRADIEKSNESTKAPSTVNGTTAPMDEKTRRISFLSPGSYSRSEDAKDYLVYGCIGSLELHTGVHFIFITSVKPLGDIEDKPVYAINKVAILPLVACEARQLLDRLAQEIIMSTKLLPRVEQQAEQSIVIQEPASKTSIQQDNYHSLESVSVVKPSKGRFSFLGLRQDKGIQKSANDLGPPSTGIKQGLSREGELSNIIPNPKRVSFDVPQRGAGNRSSTNLSTPTTIEPTLNEVAATTTTRPALSSPPSSPKIRSSQPGFFSKFKGNVLEIKPRKSAEIALTSPVLPLSDGEAIAGTTANPVNHKDASKTSTLPRIDTGHMNTSENEMRPSLSPRSPSALAAAEKFVTESTKQIADWSEEAVSGIFNTTPSFSLMRPTATSSTTAEYSPKAEHAQLASNITNSNQRAAEEEQEKYRLLDRRVIREISSIFGTGFYFSTEFNLLTSMQKRSDLEKDTLKRDAPLWQQVDKRFWWNEHLLKDFIDIEANGFILPVMQGYVEIEQCEIEQQPFMFTLISRRSRERSGLRYQRRGIDEDGNASNFVETEQLLRIVRNDSDHQVSFVQTRGSIPLFWSQSPYRLKPIPIMERSEQENEGGFKKHVDSQLRQYGQQILINLVEQHGRELIAGSAYTKYVKKLADPQVRYIEFDFHEQCKGMKYENIERLVKSLEAPIQELGYCWLTPKNDSKSLDRLFVQKGVIRTNCMDCLDRTNVVQSAIGRYILNHQLLRLGIASFPDKGLSVYEDFENTFNHVWANNGDAISREYAGTSALKGDFTRTGKRNIQGMINDATNSMARMYQNTFKDYFRQAAIDYLLGATELNVFRNLQTTAFGTAIIAPPVLPPAIAPALIAASESDLPVIAIQATNTDGTSAKSIDSEVLLPSLIPYPSETLVATNGIDVGLPSDEKKLQQEAWVKVREAAIETSAEIVISPGEEHWKGWTFICCSNEITSALLSSSSPYSPPSQKPLKSPKKSTFVFNGKTGRNVSVPFLDDPRGVFYEEKVVLLTEKALYICTYDYEMEKVLEFWRLALEKMVGIDKGAFFLSASERDPLENYGFAVVYRANVGGETLRVNSGSVRNRMKMDIDRMSPTSHPNLESVLELNEDASEASSATLRSNSPSKEEGANGEDSVLDDDQATNSSPKEELKDIRSVKFKIVKHPETSIMPFVTSSSVKDFEQNKGKANPSGYKQTAQDCVEWVVTEIIQARCELISDAERNTRNKGLSSENDSTTKGNNSSLESLSGQQQQQNRQFGRHDRSPSEEYNYQPLPATQWSSVQVDLVVRDRVLQSLEVAGQLEKHSLKGKQKKNKRSKKPFSGLFSSPSSSSPSPSSKVSRETTTALQPIASAVPATSPSNNKSWLKKWQLGLDTEDETEDEDEVPLPVDIGNDKKDNNSNPIMEHKIDTTNQQAKANVDQSLFTTETTSSAHHSPRSRNQGVFAKFKQAVKNL